MAWFKSLGGDQKICLASVFLLPIGLFIGGTQYGWLGAVAGFFVGAVFLVAVIVLVERAYKKEYDKMNIQG
ncbi:MAG: hypothetical protein AAB779_01775 [Patescibacteria group bacterium]